MKIFPWILAVLLWPAVSSAYEALPGSVWGRLSREALHHKDPKIEGNSAIGFVQQGIDWTTLPGDLKVNTYAEYDYRARSLNNDYYNAWGPAIGAEIKKSIFHLGADYYWQRYPQLGQSVESMQYYLRGFHWWDVKPRLNVPIPVRGLSGSTWNSLTYDVNNFIGAGAMGFVQQGIDWKELPYKIVFRTYVEFDYRIRDKNSLYYNTYGPAVGAELSRSPATLGVGYFWNHYPRINRDSNSLQIYLGYYFEWDLKNTALDPLRTR